MDNSDVMYITLYVSSIKLHVGWNNYFSVARRWTKLCFASILLFYYGT